MANQETALASFDEQFHKTVTAIEKRLQLLGRLPQVRIKAWLAKLKLSTSNLTWKRNRNLYARLLLEQLRAGCLEVPFNALPPEGSLPTLPAYLTYRFISPPHQKISSTCCEAYDADQQRRPTSAGCEAGFHKQRLSSGSHTAWTVMRSSAPMQLQRISPTAAGVAPNLAGYPVLSPIRCGSPPRRGYLPGQEPQQPSCSPSSRGNGHVAAQPPHLLRHGEQRVAAHSSGQMVTPGHFTQQRPTSPGAAGLLDAAAALAAEVEAGRGDAALLESRLRYAEDKLLQQEAELVRLQGQAVASRRRLKAATASTLGDLVDRYSSAAAAWNNPGSPTINGKPPSRQAAYAEAVYGPMWQLVSSIQQVLDACDQQDLQWQQAQSGAAAAAIAKFEAEWAAQDQQAYEASLAAEAETSAALQCDSTQQAADAAAAGDQAVHKQLKDTLSGLLHQAEHVLAAMMASKTAATAAAAGGQVTAAEVAAGAADALATLLKFAKQAMGRDRKKLLKQLNAAADAAAAVVAGADGKRSSNDNSSDGGSSNSSDDGTEYDAEGSAKSCQLQQQCRAHAARLQAMYQLLVNLNDGTNKVVVQLSDGQQRLLDIASNSSSVSNAVLASHDRGLAAAATAGITASLGAALSSYIVCLKEFKQQLKAVFKTAVLRADTNRGAADVLQPSIIRTSNAATHSLDRSKQSPSMSRASSAAVRSQDMGQQQPSLSRASSAILQSAVQGQSYGPRQSDVTLAGSFGAGTLSSPRMSLFNPSAGAAAAGSRVSSIAQSFLSDGSSGGGPPAGSSLVNKAPVSPRLSTFPQQPGTSSGIGSTSPLDGAELVHQRLASLSQQASRISERASQILGTNNAAGGGRSSPELLSGGRLGGRSGATSPSLLNGSLLPAGLSAGSSALLKSPSSNAMLGSSLLLGSGLKASAATASAGRLTGPSMLSAPVGNLGAARSLPSSGFASVLRPTSASPRLSGLAGSSVASGLLASGAQPSGFNSSSLAALSSRLNNLGKI